MLRTASALILGSLSLAALPLAASAQTAESAESAEAGGYDFDAATRPAVSYGPRPLYLVGQLPEGELKDKLTSCQDQTPAATDFTIGHRGAPLLFPEHTVESNLAAAGMGAGLLECDVTFTADKELVCRHAQDDLATTTNILATPLAGKCSAPFTAAADGQDATADCRTSDLTLAEFRTLEPKMDSSDKAATTVEDFMKGNPVWRTDLYTAGAHSMTHAESIRLFKALGAKFAPELKGATEDMPFDGYSNDDYAQAIVDEYKAAGIPPADVFLQSFEPEHIDYWLANEPEFAETVVYLVDPDRVEGFDGSDPESWGEYAPQPIADKGLNYISVPLFALVAPGEGRDMVASEYARAIKETGMKIIAWSLERSGPIANGNGGWYYSSVADIATDDGAIYEMVDTLAQDVGVVGIFSDWPATVTYYANCMGL